MSVDSPGLSFDKAETYAIVDKSIKPLAKRVLYFIYDTITCWTYFVRLPVTIQSLHGSTTIETFIKLLTTRKSRNLWHYASDFIVITQKPFESIKVFKSKNNDA